MEKLPIIIELQIVSSVAVFTKTTTAEAILPPFTHSINKLFDGPVAGFAPSIAVWRSNEFFLCGFGPNNKNCYTRGFGMALS